jgi:hypothetical protein
MWEGDVAGKRQVKARKRKYRYERSQMQDRKHGLWVTAEEAKQLKKHTARTEKMRRCK